MELFVSLKPKATKDEDEDATGADVIADSALNGTLDLWEPKISEHKTKPEQQTRNNLPMKPDIQ